MSKKILANLWGRCALLLCIAGVAQAQDTSAFVGTWNLDVAKTQWGGAPALKSYTVTIADAGGGKVKSSAQWVDADGTKGQIEYTVGLDGAGSPVASYPNADTVKMTKGKGNSLHMSLTKDGKLVEWGQYRLSADGKTMHATEGGKDENGKKYRWAEVFERQ